MTDDVKDQTAPRSSVEGLASRFEALRGDVDRQLRQIGHAAPARDPDRMARFSPDLPDVLPPDRVSELQQEIAALGPWLQGPFLLADNLVIPGIWRNDLRWESLDQYVGDLKGKRVLDVGSNAGYDPFMFKLRGADDVLACEPFEFIHQARFLEEVYCTGVDFQQIGWQQLDAHVHGRFDLVHCHGVLYHEPNPIGMLLRLRSMLADGGEMLFGSMLHASPDKTEYIRFVPDAYAGDKTWWFVPGRLAMRWMLEVTGFEVEELLLAEGPAGEFRTLNGYFRARPATIAAELQQEMASRSSGDPSS
jgi:SAM-dependent methyltransferase